MHLTVRQVLLLTLASLSLSAIPAAAQNPRLDRIDRAGGQRGSTFRIECQGERLGAVDQALFYRPGLSVTKLQSVDDATLQVTLQSTPDCSLGEHPLRLIGPSGISELRTVHVGPFPHVPEQEPNDGIDESQAINLGVTIFGVIDDGDVDTFRVTLNRGQRLSAEVVGLRLSTYLFDPWLGVRDSAGELVVSSDDTALLRQDPLLSFVAPRDGEYVVQIREAAFGGDLDSVYQLHVGDYPRPTIAYPAGGRRGENLAVTLIGDGTGTIADSIQIPTDAAESISYFPEDAGGIAPSPIHLRTSEFDNVLEQEPNDQAGQATMSSLRLPFALNGVIEKRDDVDQFRFAAGMGEEYEVQTVARRIGSPLDSVVSIVGPDGREVVRNDDGALHDSVLRFRAPADGEYTLSVTDHLQRGGADYVYRIEFQPIVPKLELAIPVLSQRRQQQRQVVTLGTGNCFTLLVTARRTNCSGAVKLRVEGLPEGVTATSSTIEADSHLGYVVFEAAEDAPRSHNLIKISGELETESGTVVGQLTQSVGLVFGQPRQTVYHSIDVGTIPLAVVPRAPFSLEVDQPRIPLVQDGRLDLRIRVRRAPGVDGEISLTLPFLPPWMEVPEDGVSIPEGESDCIFPLTATGDAAVRSWRVVVMGSVELDGQSTFVSSAPIEVTVARPFLDLAMARTVSEQDRTVQVDCDLEWRRPVDGQVIARLHGLPKNASAPEVRLDGPQRSVSFPVDVASDTPPSIHNTLYVELGVDQAGELVTHYLGRGGVLEVVEQGKQARETLSRLEVLRRQASRSRAALQTSPTDSVD